MHPSKNGGITRLTGRALSCAHNAVKFLRLADEISDISATVSYFCVSHAVEEAVACVIASAKDNNYKEARRISPKDHLHKVTVAQFAQMIGAQAMAHEFQIACHPSTPRLVYRAQPVGEEKPVEGILSLLIGRFSDNLDDADGAAAENVFLSMFQDEAAMINFIHERANYRNRALYALDDGVPSMARDKLDIQLRDLGRITIGLLWAAVDLSYHERREPVVLHLLNAIVRIANKVKKIRRCEDCDAQL